MPHIACAKDAKSVFSSDCTEIPQAYCRMSRDFCIRWRKKCKQISCKAVRCALCGVPIDKSTHYTLYHIIPYFAIAFSDFSKISHFLLKSSVTTHSILSFRLNQVSCLLAYRRVSCLILSIHSSRDTSFLK